MARVVKLVNVTHDRAASTCRWSVTIGGQLQPGLAVVYREHPADGSTRRYSVDLDGQALYADTSERAMKSWLRKETA